MKIKIPYRFDPETEARYQKTKFQQSKTFAIWAGFAGVLVGVGLWAWDWVIDPAGAMHMLGSRLILGALIMLYPLGLLAGIRGRALPWFFYAVVLAAETYFLHHLSLVRTGLIYGITGFLYWFILPVFMAIPFSAHSSVLGYFIILLFPHMLVRLGIAPDFELAKFTIIFLPTCIIAIFATILLDLLFRGLFVQINERKKLIKELQGSLAAIKTLRGLLPICSSCKKIRDDKGYWNQIEIYILEHSEAICSHSICPDCMGKLYPKYTTPQRPDQK